MRSHFDQVYFLLSPSPPLGEWYQWILSFYLIIKFIELVEYILFRLWINLKTGFNCKFMLRQLLFYKILILILNK